jgi:hypothetical protein
MASPGMWQSPVRLYTDQTRASLVPEDSPKAAFVVCAEGGEIPVALAQQYGVADLSTADEVMKVVNSTAPQPPQGQAAAPPSPESVEAMSPPPAADSGTAEEEEPQTKAQRPTANKAVSPGENK